MWASGFDTWLWRIATQAYTSWGSSQDDFAVHIVRAPSAGQVCADLFATRSFVTDFSEDRDIRDWLDLRKIRNQDWTDFLAIFSSPMGFDAGIATIATVLIAASRRYQANNFADTKIGSTPWHSGTRPLSIKRKRVCACSVNRIGSRRTRSMSNSNPEFAIFVGAPRRVQMFFLIFANRDARWNRPRFRRYVGVRREPAGGSRNCFWHVDSA